MNRLEPKPQPGQTVGPIRPRKPAIVVLWILTAGLIVISSFFIIMTAADFITGEYVGGSPGTTDDTKLSTLIGLFGCCGLLPLSMAGVLFFIVKKKKAAFRVEMNIWFESRILKQAVSSAGRLTAAEAAMANAISINQAKTLLDELVVRGVAEMLISESGTIVYKIHGIGEDKENAEGV